MAPDVTSEDEYWHRPDTEDSRWRESYYFDFYDPETDFAWFSTMGRRPHKGYMGSAFGVVWEGDAYFRQDYGYTTADEEIRVGGLSYTPVVPHEQWRIEQMTEINRFEPGADEMMKDADDFPSSDSPVYGLDVDVTFDALHEPQYYFTGEEREVFSPIYTGHSEQAGRVTGEVRLGDETLSIDGFGGRDHSWGPRDWFSPDSWRWLSASFDESNAIHIYRLTNDRGTAAKGYLLLDGEVNKLESVILDTEFYDDELSQKTITFEITDEASRHLRGRADVPTKPLLMGFETEEKRTSIRRVPAEFHAENVSRTGYGWTEYGQKFTDI